MENINKLTEKEKKYNEILDKRGKKIKLTHEEKIFLKQIEIDKLKEEAKEVEKKKKNSWVRQIVKVIKEDLEKYYGEEENDIKIASLIIYALENYDEFIEKVDETKYVKRNKRGLVKLTKDNERNEVQINGAYQPNS
ncbi:hypothetical protein [Cetobacterium sp.]|uniref:hypothetical protein n=1 Tax=Cetobacterium sp. TaxID=2071632 RepID=UPI003AA0F5E2